MEAFPSPKSQLKLLIGIEEVLRLVNEINSFAQAVVVLEEKSTLGPCAKEFTLKEIYKRVTKKTRILLIVLVRKVN